MTFRKFKWLVKYPRDLYFNFTIVDCTASILTFLVLLTPGANCLTSFTVAIIFQFCFFSQYLWMACLCFAVKQEFSVLSEKLSPDMDPELLSDQKMLRLRYQKLFPYIAFGIPALSTVVLHACCLGFDCIVL